MNILDPTKDAAALKPIADELEDKALDALSADELAGVDAFVARVIPALKEALLGVVDGLTVTTVTTITRKVK